MADPVDLARRFFEVLLVEQLPEFGADDVWAYLPRLLDFVEPNKPLPPMCVTIVGELAAAGNLRSGASLPEVMTAIEATFGTCPYGPETLQKLAAYLREQRNGGFQTVTKRRGPAIGGEF